MKDRNAIYFVDIDDTLFKTFANIHVLEAGVPTRKLTNNEFNSYQLQKDEEFDFHEFKDSELFKDTSTPIDQVQCIIKHIHTKVKQQPNSRIILLTARADFYDKEPFLQTFRDHDIDIDNMYVERVGNMPGSGSARKKKIVVRSYINNGKYNKVKMVDDHKGNLDSFLELQNEFSDIEFKAWHINKAGKSTLVNSGDLYSIY